MSGVMVWYANPAIDHLIRLSSLQVGEVQVANSEWMTAGGKGANVLRALKILGIDSSGISLVGGSAGELYRELLQRDGLSVTLSSAQGETRSATIISQAVSRADTVINGSGLTVTPESWSRHVQLVKSLIEAESPDFFAIAGSFPPAAQASDVTDVLRLAQEHRTQTIVDTSGAVLEAALKAEPGIVKVNEREASALMSRLGLERGPKPLKLFLADAIHELGAQLSIVTSGSAAVTANSEVGIEITPIPAKVTSTTGCGDAFLAGLISGIADGRKLKDTIAWATAVGSAAAEEQVPGDFAIERAKQLIPQTH